MHIFLTSAPVGESSKFHVLATLCPGKEPPVPIGLEAGWTPEPVWTMWRREKSVPYCFNIHYEIKLWKWNK
jgi:hypothetical protein